MKQEGAGAKNLLRIYLKRLKKTNISLPRFIYSLGIRQVGTATASFIAKNYGSFSHFMEDMKNKETEKLLEIDGIGGAMAKDIVEFFQEEHNIETIQKLLSKINVEEFIDDANYDCSNCQ